MKTQFGKKYGAEFIRRAENDADGCVNRNVVEKLSCDPPGGYVITVRENETRDTEIDWGTDRKIERQAQTEMGSRPRVSAPYPPSLPSCMLYVPAERTVHTLKPGLCAQCTCSDESVSTWTGFQHSCIWSNRKIHCCRSILKYTTRCMERCDKREKKQSTARRQQQLLLNFCIR